jgi:hypothetical protein
VRWHVTLLLPRLIVGRHQSRILNLLFFGLFLELDNRGLLLLDLRHQRNMVDMFTLSLLIEELLDQIVWGLLFPKVSFEQVDMP